MSWKEAEAVCHAEGKILREDASDICFTDLEKTRRSGQGFLGEVTYLGIARSNKVITYHYHLPLSLTINMHSLSRNVLTRAVYSTNVQFVPS